MKKKKAAKTIDETRHQVYSHTPPPLSLSVAEDIATRTVLLLDPMLATANSAIKAIEVLKDAGVEESKIVFVNLIAAPEGVKAMAEKHPEVTILTSMVDECLNEVAYIVPGIGDFGDRTLRSSSRRSSMPPRRLTLVLSLLLLPPRLLWHQGLISQHTHSSPPPTYPPSPKRTLTAARASPSCSEPSPPTPRDPKRMPWRRSWGCHCRGI